MTIMLQLLRAYRRLRTHKSLGLSVVLLLLLVSIAGNAVCFHVFDGRTADPPLTFGDALWYSIISITTIGYGDYSASSVGARLGTVFFVVLMGLSTFTVFLGMMIDWFTNMAIKGDLGMGNVVASDHVLIIHFPSAHRVRRLIDELQSDPNHRGGEIVIISHQIERLPFAIDNVLFIHGSPLEQETYQRARIGRAKMAIVLATAYDDANSDAVVASAISVIEAAAPSIQTVAECLNEKHLGLFDAVSCDAVIQGMTITDNLLVQECHDPGIAQMVNVITSNLKGATLFSTTVTQGSQPVGYLNLAKALLDRDINILCINRGPDCLTSFQSINSQPNDRVIYVASQRLDWPRLLQQAGVGS